MKSMKYLFCALLAALLAGCDDSEVFYSVRYDIVKAQVRIVTQPPVDPEAPDAAPAADPGGDAPLVRELELPGGGCYLLDYTRYDGGRLTVRTSADASPVTGEFDRQPAAKTLTFRYDGQETTYTMERYTDEATGTSCVMLSTDLTDSYRELYPDEYIVEAFRYEYTSTRY
ncbi:MAG: hypothetical protein K2K30_04045 [Alistipes sp.]|nr:hypothetical protein [Alistipes sp.]MDE6623542.1 hypothetical protein [Alistipes sp.]